MKRPPRSDGPAGLMNKRATGALVLLLVSACAALGPQIAPPKVTVIGVRLDRLEQASAYFGVIVLLANPNATDVEVSRLEASLAIEGEPVAGALLAAPVVVAAGGTAQTELSAQVGIDAVLRAAATAMRRGAVVSPGRAPTFRYSIEGAAVVGGMRVPFSREGDVGRSDAK
jgi:Late embryogenesis abundant protein